MTSGDEHLRSINSASGLSPEARARREDFATTVDEQVAADLQELGALLNEGERLLRLAEETWPTRLGNKPVELVMALNDLEGAARHADAIFLASAIDGLRAAIDRLVPPGGPGAPAACADEHPKGRGR